MGKYKVILSDQAKRDISVIETSGDKASKRKIEVIISELYEHPETGAGKPEQLKFDYSNYWSRRINKKDRMIYRIIHDTVTVNIVSAKGHYSDK